MPEMKITITKNSAGGLDFVPPHPVNIDPRNGVKLRWQSPDGHIAILIKNADDPFTPSQHTVSAQVGKLTPPLKIRRLKPSEQPRKVFSYGVAHVDAATGVLTPVDPDLILDDPGGGGGGAGSHHGHKGKPAKKKTAQGSGKKAPKKGRK